MKKLITIFASLGLLTGCWAYHSYQEYDGSWGYSDTQLTENVFRVSFIGYGETKSEVADFALLRAAEVCLENNFKYFVIKEADNYTEPDNLLIPAVDAILFEQDYRSSYIVIGYKRKPGIDAIIYDAEFVSQSIKAKYKIEN